MVRTLSYGAGARVATPPYSTWRLLTGEKKRVLAVTGGALGLSGLAAVLGLCCTVPWAVALLGVAGVVAFARLAFLIPYALIGSFALLALGFWWAYRRPAACVEGDCVPASQGRLRWLMWIAAAVVLGQAAVALFWMPLR